MKYRPKIRPLYSIIFLVGWCPEMTCKVERLRELRRFQKVPSRDAALAAAPGLISAHIGQSHSGWSFERTG